MCAYAKHTIDTQVHKAIAHLAFKHAVDDVGIATGIVQVKDWVARQQRDQSSVYSCYR